MLFFSESLYIYELRDYEYEYKNTICDALIFLVL